MKATRAAKWAAFGITDIDKNRIEILILGSGAARIHFDAINDIEGAFVSGFFSPDDVSSKDISEKYGVKRYSSYEELLTDPETEIVCICTPSGLHAKQVRIAPITL